MMQGSQGRPSSGQPPPGPHPPFGVRPPPGAHPPQSMPQQGYRPPFPQGMPQPFPGGPPPRMPGMPHMHMGPPQMGFMGMPYGMPPPYGVPPPMGARGRPAVCLECSSPPASAPMLSLTLWSARRLAELDSGSRVMCHTAVQASLKYWSPAAQGVSAYLRPGLGADAAAGHARTSRALHQPAWRSTQLPSQAPPARGSQCAASTLSRFAASPRCPIFCPLLPQPASAAPASADAHLPRGLMRGLARINLHCVLYKHSHELIGFCFWSLLAPACLWDPSRVASERYGLILETCFDTGLPQEVQHIRLPASAASPLLAGPPAHLASAHPDHPSAAPWHNPAGETSCMNIDTCSRGR